MATRIKDDSTNTISLIVDKDIIQNPKLQKFVEKVGRSQHVTIITDENYGMIIIHGEIKSVTTSKGQIEHKIGEIPPTLTIKLSIAKTNFLVNFGQTILETIRKQSGIDSAFISAGTLQITGSSAANARTKAYFDKMLFEKSTSITYYMEQHLLLNCNGRLWQEFSTKYRVGASFQKQYPKINNEHSNAPNENLHGEHEVDDNRECRGHSRGNFNCGRMGRGGFHLDQSMLDCMQRLGKINLNDQDVNTNATDNHDSEEDEGNGSYYDQDNGDNSSQVSDSDRSMFSNFPIDTLDTNDINKLTQKTVEIILCSDSDDTLSKAIAELQSYALHMESWGLRDEEINFILEQQNQGKPCQNNTSVNSRSIQIKLYLKHMVPNAFVRIYVYYTRGISYVRVSGFKSDVISAVSKIKSYLNDVVDTEIDIPISEPTAFFLKKKASSDIKRLSTTHNIKIIIISPPRRVDNTIEHDNDNYSLKLIGPASRINGAQIDVDSFLDNLLEQEQHFRCDTWDNSKNISINIKALLHKIRDSDDYKATGFVKFYNDAAEKSQTTPKVTITVVALNRETAENVFQQCKDIVEGYVVWMPSPNEYRALHQLLLVTRQPNIDCFRKEWSTVIWLENKTNTIIIPARSKIIADEIKEALQNLVTGKLNRMNKISVNFPIERRIRHFIFAAIQPILAEIKTQGVYIDSKDQNELTLRGRSEVINAVQGKINTIIKDIQQKVVTSPVKLTSVESELLRVNSYKIAARIGYETNTIIRDVQLDVRKPELNVNDNNDDINLPLTAVVNSRGQTILVMKGDITKVKDVDAIVNAASGTLDHAGGVDRAISDAAGPTLDQECKQLIVENGGIAISTGTAVKTTAGNLPYKGVIHAIGPQYDSSNNQMTRPLLFSCILSSLRLAEHEGYTSIALPAISASTYGFPLQDCTNIMIRAIKQFFADFPNSHLRKVILLDIDDAACNSFAREVVIDHTNINEDNDGDLMGYDLPPLTAKWCWQSDYGEKIYDDNHTRQIEDAFQEYLRTSIPSKLKIYCDNLKTGIIVCYSIHFYSQPHSGIDIEMTLNKSFFYDLDALNNRLVCGYQKRDNTGFVRTIIRYPLSLQHRTTAVQYQPKPLDTYQLKMLSKEDRWEIIGINSISLKQAEIEIEKAIASAKISEPFSVNLKENLGVHKRAINHIAIQQFIRIDFQQDANGNLLLTLKGFQQNILQAKLQISLYIQDVLRSEADKFDDLHTPKEWGEQEEPCKLIELSRSDPNFIRIEKRMKETMNNVTIDKIERVQNLRIWNHYAFRRRAVQQELRNKPNLQIEMELFHGTRTILPSEIYNGECGFDTRLSANGLWGKGTYFAVNASYSCQNYSFQLPNGKRQVFLAQVLTGEVADYKTRNDFTLRQAPKKNDGVLGAHYNSVCVETGGSKVYIVYETRLAYPTYLITFSY